jgi:hypothetical protein
VAETFTERLILREDLESTGAIEYYRSIGALPEQRAAEL